MEESKRKQVPARHTEHDERHNTDTETRRRNVVSTGTHLAARSLRALQTCLLVLVDTSFRLCTFFELINPNYLLCFRRKTVFPKFQKCNELVTSFDVQVCVKVCARKKRKTMRSCSSEQREKTGLDACTPHAACAASAGLTGFRGGGPAKSLMPCFLCTASSRLSSMSAASTCSSARDSRDFLKCLSLVCARDLSCSL